MMSKTKHTTPVDLVEAAIKDLIAFHEIGRDCLDQYPGTMPKGVAAKLAAEHGLHHEVIRLARRFASPKHGGYSKRDLDRLFRRSRKHAHPLNRTCVTKLLTVKDATQRSELELAMIRHEWSRSDLDDVLRLRYGKRMHAGRRPKRAKNSDDAILQILRAVEQAQRALVQYSSAEPENEDKPVKLPPKLHKAIMSTNTTLDQLRVVAQQVVAKQRDADGDTQ